MKVFGIPRPLYAPEGGAGGGGGEGGQQQQQQQQQTPVAPWGDGQQMWMVGDKPWYETLVPAGATRDLLVAKQYKNPVVQADAYHNANKMLNLDTRVALPNFETAKPEELNEFYTKLGRPANAEAYDIKAPDGRQFADANVKFAKTLAFELGLNPKQAAAMVTKYDAFQQQSATAQAEAERTANDAALTELQKTWGADLEANKAAGQRVLQALVKAGLNDSILQGVEKHIGQASVISLLAHIGKLSAEGGSFSGGDGGGNAQFNTPEAAAAEITRLRSDADFQKKFTNRNEPGHAEALKTMESLYAKAGKLAS